MNTETQNLAPVISLREADTLRWQSSSLGPLAQGLAGVEQVTESSFLQLGSNIKNLHERAKNIALVAGDVLEVLNGDGGEETLQHLQLLVERCNLWLTSTDEKSIGICGLLEEVLGEIEELDLPVTGLRKVIKTLHSLRVSTRIEAAKGYASGAGVLAKSLDELGNMAQEKVAEIFALTELLVPAINRSREMEMVAQSGSIRIARNEVTRARKLLGNFMESCLETGHWTDQLKARSEKVAESFSEIVAALQFQDITRQRLEHVQRALNNLGEHLDNYNLRQDFSKDAKAERLFGCICKLQYDQLDFAAKEFVAAADNLSNNLQEMAVSVMAMAEDTKGLVRVSDDGSENRYQVVMKALQSIADYLEETDRIHLQTGDNLDEVNRGIEEVSRLVEEVEFVGEEMQLLAINAAISAAHAHQRGAGLDIIAQNIQDVAEEACSHAWSLASQCATITEHAQHLQSMEEESQAGSDDVGKLLDEARQRMDSLDDSHNSLVKLAGKVDSDASDLSHDVAGIVHNISIADVFMDKLDPVLQGFRELSDSATTELSAAENTSLEALFKELELCYTMASERKVHQEFVESQQLNAVKVGEQDDEWAANRDHGLGDNVDLF